MVAPGRNYQWHNWEGRAHRTGTENKRALVGRTQDPLFVYSHKDVSSGGCVIGGVFYRSKINRCLQVSRGPALTFCTQMPEKLR